MKLFIVSSGHSLFQGFICMGSLVTGLCCEWEVLGFFLSSHWPMSELTSVPLTECWVQKQIHWASLINQLSVHRKHWIVLLACAGLMVPEGEVPREALSVPSSAGHRMPINLRAWKKVSAFKGLPALPQAQCTLSVKRVRFSKASD